MHEICLFFHYDELILNVCQAPEDLKRQQYTQEGRAIESGPTGVLTDLWCSVETADKIRRNVVLAGDERSRAKITQLERHLRLVNQDVVRLDVCMQYAHSLQQLQGQEHLLCVGANGLDVKANSLAVLTQDLT